MRRGFTLIELLVVLAIVAVFAGIFLPAVLAGRESGRRCGCFNNLKQIGIALQQYRNSFGLYPGSQWPEDLRPFVEGAIGRSLETLPASVGPISVYRCPNNFGSEEWPAASYEQNAFITSMQAVSVENGDGTSATAAYGEDRTTRLPPLPWGGETAAFNLVDNPPHGRGGHVLFCDGHVEFIVDPSRLLHIMDPGDGN